ncbi:hypothetical protein [Streptomyces chryseus]|uniref:hypothetical protein n=1 Tax=Streptomyces chryseus TaxID=68186 RepID=UPI0014768E6D|nr:hypothetical protein [Streptomyces chryseus]
MHITTGPVVGSQPFAIFGQQDQIACFLIYPRHTLVHIIERLCECRQFESQPNGRIVSFSVAGRKTRAVGALATLVVGGSLLAATPAQAYTSCPDSGYIDKQNTCTKLSNGILGHHIYLNGSNYTMRVVTDYYKSGGGSISRRLGSSGPFTGQSTQWGAWGNQSSGTSKWSKNFNNNLANCRNTQGLMESGGTVYKTPFTGKC